MGGGWDGGQQECIAKAQPTNVHARVCVARCECCAKALNTAPHGSRSSSECTLRVYYKRALSSFQEKHVQCFVGQLMEQLARVEILRHIHISIFQLVLLEMFAEEMSYVIYI